jgi:hypothetical protein
MTYGQDDRPDQYPRPGYGQQYRPEDQPWQPPYDPRQYQRRPSGPQEAPWQQAAYPPQEAPWQQQTPYPPQNYPPRDQWQPQQTQQDYGQFQPPQHHHRKRSRVPLFVGIAAVFAVAGGGTAYALAGHGSSPGPVAAISSPATPKPTVTPATLAQLKKMVLQPADLPSGWKGTPLSQADKSTPADDAAMAKCLGSSYTDSDQIAETDSDNFNLGNATISSSARSFRSQSDQAAYVAMFRSPKLSSCFGQMLTKQLGASSSTAGATVQSSMKFTPGSAGGPANVVATGTGTIKVQGNGQVIAIYMTVAFITGPLTEVEVDAVNIDAPVPASVMKPLVATVATRVNKG